MEEGASAAEVDWEVGGAARDDELGVEAAAADVAAADSEDDGDAMGGTTALAEAEGDE